jgi:hypothetical protein
VAAVCVRASGRLVKLGIILSMPVSAKTRRTVVLGMTSSTSRPSASARLYTAMRACSQEIARNPEARIRDISPVVGLTERSVQAIVADLEAAGYLTRARTGRRVVYTVNRDSLFRHSAQDGHQVGPFLDLLAADGTV